MTYGELYKLFVSKFPELKSFYEDYRPFGDMSLHIWLKNGMSLKVKYNKENDLFELIEKKGIAT